MVIDICIAIATFLAAVVGYTCDTRSDTGKLTGGGRWLIGFALAAMALCGSKMYLDWQTKTQRAEAGAQQAAADAARKAETEAVALRSLAWQAGRLHTIVKLLIFLPETRESSSDQFDRQVEDLRWSISNHSDVIESDIMAQVDEVLQHTDLPSSDLKNHKTRSVRLPMYLERVQRSLADLAIRIEDAGKSMKGKEGEELRGKLQYLFSNWGMVATVDPGSLQPPSIGVTVINHLPHDLLVDTSAVCTMYVDNTSGGTDVLLTKSIHLETDAQESRNPNRIRLGAGAHRLTGRIEQCFAAAEYLRRDDVKQQIVISVALVDGSAEMNGATDVKLNDDDVLSGFLRFTPESLVTPR